MADPLVDSIDYDFAKFGSPAGRTWRCARSASTATPAAISSTIRRPPSSRSPRDCRPASTASTRSGVEQPIPLAHSRSAPPMIELRRNCCPPSDRVTMLRAVCARLQLDGPGRHRDGVFVTAEGLLMYLQPDDALGLIAECATRFPGGQMMFDLPPSVVRGTDATRHADLAALPDPPDAVQPVRLRGRRTWSTPCRASGPYTICRLRRPRQGGQHAVWTVATDLPAAIPCDRC